MKKEECFPKQRLLLKSEKSPRQPLGAYNSDQNALSLRKIYTRTVYNKYNRFLDVLNSKQKNIYSKRKHKDISNQSHKSTVKLGAANQRQGKAQIMIRRHESKKEKKTQDNLRKSEENAGLITLTQETYRCTNPMNVLSNIYQTQNTTSNHRIQPKGITTKSSYYGLQPSTKNPETLIQNLKKRIRMADSLETIEQVLKQTHFE